MITFLWICAIILILIGLAGLVLPALPGIPIMFLGFLTAAWIDNFQKIGWITLTILGILTLFSFGVDFLMTSIGAKKMGASRLAITGAIIGVLVGFFLGITGIILGPFIGAMVGEYISKHDLLKAGKVGFGTWLGIVLGIAVKLGLAFTMLGIFLTSLFI